jgi:hypothetical protein
MIEEAARRDAERRARILGQPMASTTESKPMPMNGQHIAAETAEPAKAKKPWHRPTLTVLDESGGKANGKDAIRFRLTAFDDIKLETTAPYLVRGMIPREGLVVIWGPPKCGKTF